MKGRQAQILCIFVIEVYSQLSFAGRLTIEKAQSFFEKNKPCKFAVAPVYPKSRETSAGTKLNQKLTGAKNGEIYISSSKPDGDALVLCIWDSIHNAGTINESAGCEIGLYNPRTTRYSELTNGMDFIASEKKCDRATAIQLLTDPKYIHDYKKTYVGGVAENTFGSFYDVFQLFLRMHTISVLDVDAYVIYDEFKIGDTFCPKKPCGPYLNLEEQGDSIKPDPASAKAEAAYREQLKLESEKQKREEAAAKAAEKRRLDDEKKAAAKHAEDLKIKRAREKEIKDKQESLWK